MKRTMTSKKLLLGTVALMAGVGLASAQGMREGTSGTAGAGAEQHGTSSAARKHAARQLAQPSKKLRPRSEPSRTKIA